MRAPDFPTEPPTPDPRPLTIAALQRSRLAIRRPKAPYQGERPGDLRSEGDTHCDSAPAGTARGALRDGGVQRPQRAYRPGPSVELPWHQLPRRRSREDPRVRVAQP